MWWPAVNAAPGNSGHCRKEIDRPVPDLVKGSR
jgi:hypothetical protein